MFIDITSWWQGMVLFEKILWVIALLFSTLFILQTVFSIIMGGDTDDADAFGDTDDYVSADQGIGYQFLTIKNLIAFFTLFGWTGITAFNSGLGKGVSVLLGCIAGALMVIIMAVLMRYIGKLKESGTLQIRNALNQIGTVYLLIPGQRKGTGKVHIKIQGSLREMDALTDDPRSIATGSIVKVNGLIDDSVLLVTAQLN